VRSLSRLVFVPFFLLLAACQGDIWGRFDPVMYTDTFELAAPSANHAAVPTALDVTASGGVIRGGRFPERLRDADEGWDVAVRVRDGELTFVPPTALGFPSRAGVTRALAGQTFEGLSEVPGGARVMRDSAVVVQRGAVYVVRSRDVPGIYGSCYQFAKVQPLDADPVAGTVRVQVSTNERCADPRLFGAN
jgi:hypothetical protein